MNSPKPAPDDIATVDDMYGCDPWAEGNEFHAASQASATVRRATRKAAIAAARRDA